MNPSSKKYSKYFTYIEPVLKTPAIRTYGSLILSIVSLIVFIVFAIKPTLTTISNLQKELEVKQKTLKALEEKSRNLTLAKTNLENIPEDTKTRLQTMLPKQAEISALIKTLEATTIKSQATISAIQFQPLTIEPQVLTLKDPKVAEISFVYNIENSYPVVNQVLQNLKANPRILVIDNFSITKIADTQNLLLSVSGRAFYVK